MPVKKASRGQDTVRSDVMPEHGQPAENCQSPKSEFGPHTSVPFQVMTANHDHDHDASTVDAPSKGMPLDAHHPL